MDEDVTQNPHDKFFKEAFSNKSRATELFRQFLPKEIVEAADWQTLERIPDSFISQSMRESRSDLLFEVTLSGNPIQIYCVFEHQSTQDKLMPLRLLGYMVQIWERFVKEHPNNTKLPPIIPLVLHQSLSNWQTSEQFQVMLDIPDHFRDELAASQPSFAHLLIDLPEISDIGRFHMRLAVVFKIMRTVEEKNIVESLEQVAKFLSEALKEDHDIAFLRTCFNYLLRADVNVDKKDFMDKLSTIDNSTIKEQAMSIADVLIQEGRQEGLQEGRQEGLSKGLISQIITLHSILGSTPPDAKDLASWDIQTLESHVDKIQSELKNRIESGDDK